MIYMREYTAQTFPSHPHPQDTQYSIDTKQRWERKWGGGGVTHMKLSWRHNKHLRFRVLQTSSF